MTQVPQGCAWVRVLATSDVHAHLRSFDYARNEPVEDWGLTRLATRIREAREEAPTSILLDNGDILQGTPLAQLYSDEAHTGPHPVLSAMEALAYDAVGLGNHEFNYGLDRLRAVIAQTSLPVLCANVLTRKGDAAEDDQSLFPATALLHRTVIDPDTGTPDALRIGVLSVVPTQVMKWDGAHLINQVETRDMVSSAAQHVAALREAGADLVVLLAHTGIDPDVASPEAENAAVALAQIPGVDAMITGHTHRLFPDPSVVGTGIEAETGTIFGVPTVMPGYRGGHLGVIDLYLRKDGSGWHVAQHQVALQPVVGAEEDPDLVRLVEPAHQATLRYVDQALGQTARPIHSYLSQVRDDLSTRIVAMAQKSTIQARLAGSAYENLPLLSASAPYQTGGRAGTLAYVDIPSGPLRLRDANSLYPFPNTLCAVHVTGAELRDWLERAASAYCLVRAGQGAQPLLNPGFPGHAMDTIYGVTYQIDLSIPPQFDEDGARLVAVGAPSRIRDLAFEGRPVGDSDQFVVAVNGYRAYGGGPYPPRSPDRILVQTEACALRYVSEFLERNGADSVEDGMAWSFAPVAGAMGIFETGPGIMAHPEDLARCGLTEQGLTEDGFLRLAMPLDRSSCESAA